MSLANYMTTPSLNAPLRTLKIKKKLDIKTLVEDLFPYLHRINPQVRSNMQYSKLDLSSSDIFVNITPQELEDVLLFINTTGAQSLDLSFNNLHEINLIEILNKLSKSIIEINLSSCSICPKNLLKFIESIKINQMLGYTAVNKIIIMPNDLCESTNHNNAYDYEVCTLLTCYKDILHVDYSINEYKNRIMHIDYRFIGCEDTLYFDSKMHFTTEETKHSANNRNTFFSITANLFVNFYTNSVKFVVTALNAIADFFVCALDNIRSYFIFEQSDDFVDHINHEIYDDDENYEKHFCSSV